MRTEAAHWGPMGGGLVPPPRRAGIQENVLDGEAILFDAASGATHRLNETALAIWRQCDGQTDSRRMAERLVDSYEVEPETALLHVEQVIVLFVEADLLESNDSA